MMFTSFGSIFENHSATAVLSCGTMQVHRGVDKLPAFQNSVITIGTFDGVHKGHQKIIAALKAEALDVDGESVIVTFHPHPRKVVQPDKPLQLINTLDEKIELLRKAGIDHLVIVPFNEGFSEMTADDYIEHFLIKNFKPASITIGYDHHFGKGRTGNYRLLEENAQRYGYRLREITKQVLNEIDISSTRIRSALLQGDVDTANDLLGYSFFFEGEVVKGDQLGRTIGYPTANLEILDADKIHLGHGVFAAYAAVDEQRYKALLSIGTRPTLEKSEEKVEANLVDFSGDLYGKRLRITVEKFLRKQEKYPSLQDMVAQLDMDKTNALSILKD